MVPRVDDRWLWLGVGVVCVLAIPGIRYAIKDIISSTPVPIRQPTKHEARANRDVECSQDGISLVHLKTLTESPNDNIAQSAIQLLVSRVHRSPGVKLQIRKDLRSEDQAVRRRATVAMDFLKNYDLPSSLGDDGWLYDRGGVANPLRCLETRDRFAIADQDGRLNRFGPTVEQDMMEVNPWAIPEEGEEIVPSIENPVAGWTNVPRQRSSTGEQDQWSERRGRREAMVMISNGDGTHWSRGPGAPW